MRVVFRYLALAAAVVLGGCETTHTVFVGTPSAPQNLSYELDPSGDANLPAGILLAWDPVQDANVSSYRIYSRPALSGSYGLRGETTSNTFHDNGVPDAQYYVTTVDVDGNESDASNVITVDERLQLEAPSSLSSVSLNGAVDLFWSDNAYLADPADFKWYRVYSASYDLNSGFCGTDWVLEGTTVGPEFLVTAIANGVPRCYGVSAISVEGYESVWSPLRQDTPRPDARNVVLFAPDTDLAHAGFRFWNDLNSDGIAQDNELGLVTSGSLSTNDFAIYRNPGDSTLWINPVFSGDSVQLYADTAIADLTSIDFAPASGYARNMIEAVPGYGYVFQIIDGSTLRYAALRVTAVGKNYVIFDWSFQTDPGNPELIRRAGLPTAAPSGSSVKRR
ncbi:MAG TPA: hypothetical protein VFK78_00215 [Gemmatimonadales bacterium]|nr:hypothetical protein [Gemmatimonadales bacterium]